MREIIHVSRRIRVKPRLYRVNVAFNGRCANFHIEHHDEPAAILSRIVELAHEPAYGMTPVLANYCNFATASRIDCCASEAP